MKCVYVFLLVLTCLVQLGNSERILALSFFSSKSHKLTYIPLLEELAARGHEITILSPVKPFKEIKGIKEIYTFEIEKSDMFQKWNPFEMKSSGASMNPFVLLPEFGEICKTSYDLPHVKAILKEKFDLIFMQPMFNDCALGLVYRLKAPLVLFFPTSVNSFMVNKIGGDLPASFVGNPFLGYSDEMNFKERFINFGVNVFFEAILRFYYEPFMTQIYRDILGEDIPNVREILGNASLVLSNGHFSLAKPKPYLPDVVDVGGLHSRPAKPLPKDLEDFIAKGGKNGFILFSMGSAIQGDKMPNAKRQLFLNVFSKLKQQVLWKWESETMPNLPPNVKLSKWLPQQDLLGHSSIKMFMTHCGGGSTEEAIYHGVPLVGFPMFGDQNLNAQQAKDLGFLVGPLEWNDVTEEALSTAINDILNNRKYRENAKRLSSIFTDQPTKPLERGVYWVEYIMRHKGAPHLRSASRKLNYFQYHSWDVIAAFITIIGTIIYLIYVLLRFIVRKICKLFWGCSKTPKTTPKVKKQKKIQ